MTPPLDLAALDLTSGAATLLRRALAGMERGAELRVRGSAPSLELQVEAFARGEGHSFRREGSDLVLVSGGYQDAARRDADRAGGDGADGVVDSPAPGWGIAARGALVERGGLDFGFPLANTVAVWAHEAARLYRAASAAQWNPETAIPWATFEEPAAELEDAVVQVMTYLVENENAALLVPSRFLGRIHPHFREVAQLLAIQIADEARHIEVFTRRASLSGRPLGLSTVAGQRSLKTLLDEHDFSLASFLLSVLGEGTFLSLLRFLAAHAPDPITRKVVELAAQDEARHVAFGVAHLRRHAAADRSLLPRLAAAVERRHDALASSAGLNERVLDALVVLGGSGADVASITRGDAAVRELLGDMDAGRRRRLEQIGFAPGEAEQLSALHTRNFM